MILIARSVGRMATIYDLCAIKSRNENKILTIEFKQN